MQDCYAISEQQTDNFVDVSSNLTVPALDRTYSSIGMHCMRSLHLIIKSETFCSYRVAQLVEQFTDNEYVAVSITVSIAFPEGMLLHCIFTRSMKTKARLIVITERTVNPLFRLQLILALYYIIKWR